MATGLLNIGLTGLSAAQYGMTTTQHNIANVNTTGYNRQQIGQATNIALATGSGYMGQGVSVTTVKRVYDQFLTSQINKTQTSVSALDAYAGQIEQIDSMLADNTSGLTPAMQDFFQGVQDLSANASLLSSRQSMASTAQSLVSRFQSMDGQLEQLYDGVNSELDSSVGEINAYSKQIADMNQRIKLAQAANNQPANDLMDQRDQLIADLSQRINITTYTDSNGDFNVFTGSGQQLVAGRNTRELTTTQSKTDPSRLTVALKGLNGGPDETLPEDLITGGTVGGVLKFRNETLDKTSNQLGQVAVSLALTMNAQQALGQDLNGASQLNGTGFQSNFFTLPTPGVRGESDNTGTGSPAVTFADPGGNPASGNFSTAVTTSDYQLAFDGTNYTLTRLSDNTKSSSATLAGLNQDGLEFANPASGTIAAGDSFLIQPTRGMASQISVNPVIAGDVSKIAAASPARLSSLSATDKTNSKVNAGSMSASVSVGPDYQSALSGSLSKTSTATTDTVKDIRISFSGGNLSLAQETITTNKVAVPPTTTSSSAAYTLPAGTTLYATYGASTATPVSVTPGSIPFNNASSNTLTQLSLRDGSGNVLMTVDLKGTPVAGDEFRLELNGGGVSDNSNALKMAKLQTQATTNNGQSTFQAAYAQMVSSVGSMTKQVQVTSQAQTALLEQNQATRDSLSGVNLDEEAVNLVKYQQAYQASAKMVSMGSDMFNTLLQVLS